MAGQEEMPEGNPSTFRVSGGSESSSSIPQIEATCTAATHSLGDVTKDLHAGTGAQTAAQESPSVAESSDSRRQDLGSELKDSDGNKHRVILELESKLGGTARSDTAVTSPSSITTKQSPEFECAATANSKQKPPLLPAGFKQTVKDPSQESLEEIDAMCTPCDLEFQCSVFLGIADELPGVQAKKKRKREGSSETMLASGSGNETSGEGIMLSFELIQGNDNDSLHQIVQYIKNKLQLLQ